MKRNGRHTSQSPLSFHFANRKPGNWLAHLENLCGEPTNKPGPEDGVAPELLGYGGGAARDGDRCGCDTGSPATPSALLRHAPAGVTTANRNPPAGHEGRPRVEGIDAPRRPRRPSARRSPVRSPRPQGPRPGPRGHADHHALSSTQGSGFFCPLPPTNSVQAFGLSDEDELKWINGKLDPPLRRPGQAPGPAPSRWP